MSGGSKKKNHYFFDEIQLHVHDKLSQTSAMARTKFEFEWKRDMRMGLEK